MTVIVSLLLVSQNLALPTILSRPSHLIQRITVKYCTFNLELSQATLNNNDDDDDDDDDENPALRPWLKPPFRTRHQN